MNYLRTTLATDWTEGQAPEGMFVRLLKTFVPEANPGYDNKMHLIREWYLEFDTDENPWREIGLDARGAPVIAGPSNNDYGFWLDTNMKRDDFEGDPITQAEFEQKWTETGVSVPE
ncbi:MAG: hypothetical protein K0U72_03075 [Gammaproteobacteria bacterium]|nr:hypothetical protein [Gammaproteobacteria bacterium]